ncbi:hypothetical protein INR49_002544, partial [Caranx melampygus]
VHCSRLHTERRHLRSRPAARAELTACGEEEEMKQVQEKKKQSAAHVAAGNHSLALTLSAHLRTIITMPTQHSQRDRMREREWASGHSADPSTSLEEITPTTTTAPPRGALRCQKH